MAIKGGLNCKGGSEEGERISSGTPEYGERDGEAAGEGEGEISPERGGGATNRMVVLVKKQRKTLKQSFSVKGLT